MRLDPWVQFFASRGFAVLDVDYRGSTGYGRAYRNALRGSAVVDPDTWRLAAPKFQAHHADMLIGSESGPDLWRARSVLRAGAPAQCPILALYGDQDTVTPLSHAAALTAALGDSVSLIVYHGEGHQMRKPENVANALTAELAHYRKALDM